PRDKLTEEQKQTISALGTLAAGLAGGLTGGSTADAVAVAQAGKNAVENNALGMLGTAAEAAANTAAAVAGATGNGSRGSANGDDWDAGGGCEGTREQCAVRDPNRDGTRGPGHVLNDDGSDKENPPNVAGNMTDDEKAELGGAGSGTPGGWGPDDEGKARAGENASQNDSGKFEAAKDRYPKQYDQYSKLPDKNLEKAISKHEKQIAEHQGYLTDPAKRKEHVPNWDNLSPQHQENLMHHWQQDVNRHEAYKSIAEGVLKGRK
ncbi:VENN motif pre-toxin domain-containing protein, partial [Pluralibacter gergoviae]|uniref:VENN motif pre-toxin domain-containing protein n=1 Tax=Pluralibacter gergoviae TaxID=61647 RepID=UPI002ED89D96